MSAVKATYPEAIFLRRPDSTGYGFFYYGESDFLHAAESFSQPVLRSFDGEPVEGQPDPQAHLKLAITTFIGQAFDKAVPGEVGPEGVSRAVAACARHVFAGAMPRIIVIEHKSGRLHLRAGSEFLKHPGHPLAVVVDADAHGGEAMFFDTAEEFHQTGETSPGTHCWLPQVVYRLYQRTPSVVAGRPSLDQGTGKHRVEFRAITFGTQARLVERPNQ